MFMSGSHNPFLGLGIRGQGQVVSSYPISVMTPKHPGEFMSLDL